ncbi:MAG: S-layer homology domain-containing protein [Lachnospirales bacterium]
MLNNNKCNKKIALVLASAIAMSNMTLPVLADTTKSIPATPLVEAVRLVPVNAPIKSAATTVGAVDVSSVKVSTYSATATFAFTTYEAVEVETLVLELDSGTTSAAVTVSETNNLKAVFSGLDANTKYEIVGGYTDANAPVVVTGSSIFTTLGKGGSGNGGNSGGSSSDSDWGKKATTTRKSSTTNFKSVNKTVDLSVSELNKLFEADAKATYTVDLDGEGSVKLPISVILDAVTEGVETVRITTKITNDTIEEYDMLSGVIDLKVELLDKDEKVVDEVTKFPTPLEISLYADKTGNFDDYAVLYATNESFAPHNIDSNGLVTITTKTTGSYFVANNPVEFSDADYSAWYGEDVAKAGAKHIVYGTEADRFSPSASVKTNHYGLMIQRALQLTDGELEAVLAGLDSEATLTREELAYLTANVLVAAGVELSEGSVDFNDADDINSDYVNAIAGCNELGIMVGMGENDFDPQGEVTRAQATRVLVETLEEVGYTNK